MKQNRSGQRLFFPPGVVAFVLKSFAAKEVYILAPPLPRPTHSVDFYVERRICSDGERQELGDVEERDSFRVWLGILDPHFGVRQQP